ncbi:hypothetical protein [Rugosimonospora africana]|uniref:hypothetical protein n=1 Tax=Rugosimonospora africana TaxID=556532 RepID=UPI0019446E81|nr:hypothetical protein [Rugosimonospora africana]
MVQQVQKIFIDSRHLAFCAYCGNAPVTRDHVPPRVFLDKPYPDNVPVVGSCFECNNDASRDEEYVACLLEAAVCNSVDPSLIQRPGIARILQRRPTLAARIGAALTPNGLSLTSDDLQRIARVLSKMARGLWRFECGEPTGAAEATVTWCPLPTLTASEAEQFFALEDQYFYPEIGSRMFIRYFSGEDAFGWQEVQADRFSYLIQTDGLVKMVVRGYLAAEVLLVEGGCVHRTAPPSLPSPRLG